MSDIKDPSLRLFGTIIPLTPKDKDHAYNNDSDYQTTSSSNNSKQGENRGLYQEELSQEPKNKNPPGNKKGRSSTISDQTSSTNPNGQKSLKKPDKIEPCPRCNSISTKFCYFNNYNLNQPRHFCRDCQRYWTAGGTMRNIPVGAGRRKNKHSSASHHRSFLVPEAPELRVPSNRSFGFVHEDVNSSLFFIGNGLIPQGLTPQIPFFQGVSRSYTLNSMSCNSSTSSSPNCPSSRKHPRDGTILLLAPSGSNNEAVIDEKSVENARVVIPKTSKVDDPIEASNSSIRNTLQIKNDHRVSTPIVKGGFFGGSQKLINNGHNKERISSLSDEKLSTVLELNPAAFSRSLSFCEIAR